MHVQNKYSWIKHIDFIVLNLASLVISFLLALHIKFGSISIILHSSWDAVLLVLCLINIAVTLAINPYSGILRRPYYVDVIKLFQLTLYSFILVTIFFYLLKIGAVYSRVTLGLTFVFYLLLSILFLYVRKRLILTGRIQLFNVRERQLLAIINYEGMEEFSEEIRSEEVREYKIAGYCLPKDDIRTDEIDGVPVIDKADVADFAVNNHIDDIYISVDPGLFPASSYKAFMDNGINVNLDIESLVGMQPDDQFISKVGAYNTLCVGPYAMDSNQAFYLMIKEFWIYSSDLSDASSCCRWR